MLCIYDTTKCRTKIIRGDGSTVEYINFATKLSEYHPIKFCKTDFQGNTTLQFQR